MLRSVDSVRSFGNSTDLRILEVEVLALRGALLSAEAARADVIATTHPSHRRSAANLVHYVELRNMVTLPTDAADDPELVEQFVDNDADELRCRINTELAALDATAERR